MNKILLSLTAAAVLVTAAAPAAAQTWRGQDNGYGQNRPYAGAQRHNALAGLEWKIDSAAREGRLSRPEARRLLAELRQLQPIAWKVQAGRASPWERQRLERMVNRIERATYARNDRYDAYDRGGRGDRDYGYGYGPNRR